MLDIHAMRAEDAEPLIDRYIDDCLALNEPCAVINHGKGSGVLRNLVRRLAKSHPHVDKVAFAHPRDGGEGVTIVYFK